MLIPEVNLGQLLLLLRARFLIDAIGYNKVRGKPFRIVEIVEEAARILEGRTMTTETNGHDAAQPGTQPRERPGHRS